MDDLSDAAFWISMLLAPGTKGGSLAIGFIGIAASNWDTCEDAMDWGGVGIDVVAKVVTYPLPPVASDFAAKGLSYALRTTPDFTEEERAFREESWRRAQGTWR